MNRLFWSLVFCSVPIGAVAVYLVAGQAGFLETAVLPENLSASGVAIDQLYWLIHKISALILLGTGLILSWSLFRFSHPGARSRYVHGNLKIEILWTVFPAAILVWLAFHQMDSWSENKIRHPQIVVDGQSRDKPPLARVTARQFAWEILYAGADGVLDTPDDLAVQNELIVPVDEPIVLQLQSVDVIHSFFVPKLRLKQDIVPGNTQFCWFRVLPGTAEEQIDFLCAELCGWGHYKMNGAMILVSREEFESRMRALAEIRHQQ